MAKQYDGAVTLVTKLESRDLNSQMLRVVNQIKKTTGEISDLQAKMDEIGKQKRFTEKAVKEIKDLEGQLKKAQAEYSKLQAKAASKGTETSAYSKLKKDLSVATAELEKLVERQTEWEKMGVPQSGGAWDSLNNQIINAGERVESLKEKLNALEESGKAFHPKVDDSEIEAAGRTVDDLKEKIEQLKREKTSYLSGNMTEEYQKAQKQVEKLNDKLAVSNRKLEEMRQKQQPVENSYDRMKNSAAQMSETIKKVGNNARKSFSETTNQANKMTKSINSSRMGFGKMLAMSVAFSAVFRAISAITSGVGQGFTNLMGYSSEFAETIQSLKNALATLGNAFATAFAPIINIVVPALNSLINALSEAITYVAQFVAALGGNTTFLRAKKVQDSYNDSLNGTASAAKKASGALAKFDDLDVLQKQDSEDAGGGTDAGDMFEEVPIDPELLKWLDGVQAMLGPILDYIKELKDAFMEGFWDGLGDYEYRFEAIKEGLQQIKDALIDIWTDPAVLNAADNWAKSFMYMLGSLAGSIASVGLTIATAFIGGLGQYLEDNTQRIKNYLISMFNVGAEINMLLAELFQSVAYIFEAFASESGIRFMAALIGVIADSAMGLTELALKIGRDFLQMLILPITENAEGFKTALEGYLGAFATVLAGVKTVIDSVFDTFGEVYDAKIKPLFDSIAKGFSSFVSSFLEVWNGQIQPIIDRVADKISELLTVYIVPLFTAIIEQMGNFASILQTFWETVLAPLVEWVISYVVPIIAEIFGTFVEVVISVIETITSGLTELMNFVNGTIMPIWQTAWDNAGILFQAFYEVLNSIGQIIKDLFTNLLKFIRQVIVEKDWKGAWETAKNFFTTFKENISNLIEKILDFFKSFIEWIIKNILDVWGIGWDEARENFENFKSRILDTIEPIIEAFKNFIEWVGKAIKAVEDFFASGVEKISGAIGAVFGGGGGGSAKAAAASYFAAPMSERIPALADGAVIRGGNPFLALLGDQPAGQTNVETPLATIEQAVRNVVGQRDTAATPLTININYDGETFARLSLNDILSEAARQGYDVDLLGWQG